MVVNLIFFRSSYQCEVEDNNKNYWVFLKLSDSGDLLDKFCLCNKPSCNHISISHKFVLGNQGVPLHLTLESSLWNILCKKIFDRSPPKLIVKDNLFHLPGLSIVTKTEYGKKKMLDLLLQTSKELDSNSWVFSLMGEKELELWKKGNPSKELLYEISIWSFFAHWLLYLEQKETMYNLRFDTYERLPKKIKIDFKDIELEVDLFKDDFSGILSKLYNYCDKVSPFSRKWVDKIGYDNGFSILFRKVEEPIVILEVWNKWEMIRGSGFFAKQDLFDSFVSKDLIGDLLDNSYFWRFLKGKIFPLLHKTKLHLYFDNRFTLFVETYLFEKGDIESSYNGRWASIKGKFYRVSNIFNTKISKDSVEEFVQNNQDMLVGHKGFQLFPTTIESRMKFCFKDNTLFIEEDRSGNLVDFGKYIYVVGKGFFYKHRKGSSLFTTEVVGGKDVSKYIDQNKEELSCLSGFFNEVDSVDGVYLDLIVKDELIQIEPVYSYKGKFEVVGDYLFTDKGFLEIPGEFSLPVGYSKKVVVNNVSNFIVKELPKLQKYIKTLDKSLIAPETISLVITYAQKFKDGWKIQWHYKTNLGLIPVEYLQRGIHSLLKVMPTDGGVIDLEAPNFKWLGRFKKIEARESFVYITLLEWLTVRMFEKVLFEGEGKLLDFKLFTECLEEDVISQKKKLHSYQYHGLKWLWSLYTHGLSGLLCDEMGLGKTHQAMSLIELILTTKNVEIVVFCPTSVIFHWERLLSRHIPSAKVKVHHGSKRGSLSGDYNILLSTYGILRQDSKLFYKKSFELMVIDEIHIAKNRFSQIHKILKGIKCKMKLGLTGTPIENSAEDIKTLFDIVLPRFLPKVEALSGGQSILCELVSPFILRRRKKEILHDLPEKREEIFYVGLSDEQKELYADIVRKSKSSFVGDEEHSPLHIFALLGKLKQVCNHPSMIHKDLDRFYEHSSGKWDLFVKLIQDIRLNQEKVVVFSQYLDMIEIMRKYLVKEGIEYALVQGNTKFRKREVDRFQKDPNCEVFLGSIQASGVGIDLTAASFVIHYDRWWNPSKENQCTDRVYRMGQKRGVMVFKMITKDSIEEDIDKIIERKKKLISDLVQFDSSEKILTKEDLKMLLTKIYKVE